MDSKECILCKQLKSVSEYYTHSTAKDRLFKKCKECCIATKVPSNKTPKEYANWELYNARRVKTFRKENPEIITAQSISRRLGARKGFAKHHWNYNEDYRLDIIWLTTKDHRRIHLYLKYDKPTMMFRDASGILLDTKEKHNNYINIIIKNHVIKHYNIKRSTGTR